MLVLADMIKKRVRVLYDFVLLLLKWSVRPRVRVFLTYIFNITKWITSDRVWKNTNTQRHTDRQTDRQTELSKNVQQNTVKVIKMQTDSHIEVALAVVGNFL